MTEAPPDPVSASEMGGRAYRYGCGERLIYRPERVTGPRIRLFFMRMRRLAAPSLLLSTTRVPPDCSGSMTEMPIAYFSQQSITDCIAASILTARLKR